jgi:hypothetical protein
VTTLCTVLIAAPHHLPPLEARLTDVPGEKFLFPDAEALQALEVITKRKPPVIVLSRMFAATPRGAALIHRIKADPSLDACEIRVVAHDSDYMRVSPRKSAASAALLDQRGTRRAPRFKVSSKADATVDGQQALLIDLSTMGAQVMSSAVMKPSQRVRVSLADDVGQVRFDAEVAWASFELMKRGGPRYRAGLAFVDADAGAVGAYCSRHKAG